MDSESVKKAIIRQVLVESNTNNSRQLFEACPSTILPSMLQNRF